MDSLHDEMLLDMTLMQENAESLEPLPERTTRHPRSRELNLLKWSNNE